MEDKKLLGALGEEMAASILYSQGLDILERNYRCRIGEIDIIARNEEEIVFVEVKTRMEPTVTEPAQSVGAEKQRTIRKTVEYYMLTKNLRDLWISFQVIEIMINQIQNAF